MQAAFLGTVLLPPPAPGAKIFPYAHGAGAGCAADAGVEAVVQRVVIEVVAGDVVPDIAPSPVGQWVELQQPGAGPIGACGVEVAAVDQRHLGAGGGLFAPQTRDPSPLALQRPAQRLDFADGAAG